MYIFKDTSDYRFHIWATQKYKEVMGFAKKYFVYDEEVMQTDDIITYGFLVKDGFIEYRNSVESKQWEPTDKKKISKDEPLLLMDSTMAIESPVNKTVEKVYCKICHIDKYNKTVVE